MRLALDSRLSLGSVFSVHKHQFRWQAGKEPGIFVASAEAQGVTSKSLRLWLRVLVRGKGVLAV
jgi:hypothetical protein